MQRKPCLHIRLDRTEVQPHLSVFPDKVRGRDLSEVGDAQAGIAAEQEGVEHVAQPPILHIQPLQPPQFHRGQELVPAFLLTDPVFPERVRVGMDVAAVDGLVDQRAELAHVFRRGVYAASATTQERLEIFQKGVGHVGEVHSWTEFLQQSNGGQKVAFRTFLLVGRLDRVPGEHNERHVYRLVFPHCLLQQGQSGRGASFPERKFDLLKADHKLIQHGVQIISLRMATDLRSSAVPAFRFQV